MILEALDRQSVVPLYYQIQQHLLGQVRSGALKSGQPVPSEQEISARLGVSRMTARQALKSLCELGVAYSQRGKGTFVSAIKLEKDFRRVLSFSEEMQKRGARPRSKVLSFEISPASVETAEALHISPADKVIRLRRIRMANSLALGIECSHIPAGLCPDLVENFDPRTSLYRTLASRYGIEIAITDEVAEAGLAKAEEARLLRIAKGSPVFLFTRTSYVHSGKPVEFVKSIYRADRYKIVNRLTRSRKTASEGRN
ncbi:MAG TPA: GntR family transcriptional regulator [Candidatus Acidoferrales bacterium]|nr:GntR family transcriptional regulator [Candidatus Acidoferrales bacterium]